MGIPVKTRHNEVAPNQFELAPIYEEANLANDHNQLLMTIMNKIARRHNFRILLHEKPFKGVNGSGKHNNWSLGTDTGVNLLGPGKTPSENLQFITFLVNVMAAVYRHNGRAQSLDHERQPTPTGWEPTKRRPLSFRPFWAHRFRPCSKNWKRAAAMRPSPSRRRTCSR